MPSLVIIKVVNNSFLNDIDYIWNQNMFGKYAEAYGYDQRLYTAMYYTNQSLRFSHKQLIAFEHFYWICWAVLKQIKGQRVRWSDWRLLSMQIQLSNYADETYWPRF